MKTTKTLQYGVLSLLYNIIIYQGVAMLLFYTLLPNSQINSQEKERVYFELKAKHPVMNIQPTAICRNLRRTYLLKFLDARPGFGCW
jgi:hypothetical protein